MSGRFSPLGRPKWASSRTIAPRSASSVTVGSVARNLVSSVTSPSAIGTLRSTRTSAFFPRTSPRSSSVLNDVMASEQLRHRAGGIDHAVREAPFIVVPGEDADELAFEHRRLEAVDGRARRIVVIIDRDQFLLAIIEDALQPPALRRRLERAVHLLEAGVALRREGEVDQADIGGRNADRRAVELALQFGKHLADGAGGAGGGRDHRHCGRT